MTDISLKAAPPRPKVWLTWLAAARAWLFLVILLVFFEAWAQVGMGRSFVFNIFNLQSVTVYTVTPLLLALGQTLVIIAGGIDLSVGFIMGLSAVIAALTTRYLGPTTGPELAVVCAILAAGVVASIPGTINGVLVARLK